MTADSEASSPTRKNTRSAHTERLRHLPVDVTSSPGAAEKRRTATEASPAKSSASSAAIWDIIYSAKSKSTKGKRGGALTDRDEESDTVDENSRLNFEEGPHDGVAQIRRTVAENDDVMPPPRKKRKTDQAPQGIKKPQRFALALEPKTNGYVLHDGDVPVSSPPSTPAAPHRATRSSARRVSQVCSVLSTPIDAI